MINLSFGIGGQELLILLLLASIVYGIYRIIISNKLTIIQKVVIVITIISILCYIFWDTIKAFL